MRLLHQRGRKCGCRCRRVMLLQLQLWSGGLLRRHIQWSRGGSAPNSNGRLLLLLVVVVDQRRDVRMLHPNTNAMMANDSGARRVSCAAHNDIDIGQSPHLRPTDANGRVQWCGVARR